MNPRQHESDSSLRRPARAAALPLTARRSAVMGLAALLVAAGAAFAAGQAWAQAQPAAASGATAIKLSVNGMVCAFCAQGIEARLKNLPETADLYINLKQKVVAVQAKPGQTLAIDKVKAEVVEAGYEVTRAEPMTQTVAQLRESMRAAR
jgi:periplasmic mercuric ion binding protein